MPGSRYMLAALSYFKNVVPVVHSQNPLRIRSHSLLQLNNVVTKRKEICTDCPVCDETQKSMTTEHKWKDTVMLIVGAPKVIVENIMRMGIQEGVQKVTNLHSDKAYGERMQHMFCLEYKDANKVRHINCDITNETQLIKNLQSVMSNKNNPYVVVNDVNFLYECKSQEEIESNVSIFMNSNLTAFNLMRTDNNGKGGAIINMVAMCPSCPHPSMPVCKATRSMDIILASCLDLDYEKFFQKTGVRVMTVCYGSSDVCRNTDTEMRSLITPVADDSLLTSKIMSTSAAKAVIDIFKFGENGTTWLSKQTKPAEDITVFIEKPDPVPQEEKGKILESVHTEGGQDSVSPAPVS